MSDAYNYGPLEHQMAGGTFANNDNNDAPAAPERGERNDKMYTKSSRQTRQHIHTCMFCGQSGTEMSNEQHSTLIAQRERLIDALFSAVSEIEILEQALEEYHGTRQPNPTLAIIREAIAEVEQQQQAITTSQQEGR